MAKWKVRLGDSPILLNSRTYWVRRTFRFLWSAGLQQTFRAGWPPIFKFWGVTILWEHCKHIGNPHGSTLPAARKILTTPSPSAYLRITFPFRFRIVFSVRVKCLKGKKTSPLPNQKRKWIDTRLTNSAYAFFKCPPELVTCNGRQRRQLCQTIVAPPWAIHRNRLCSSYSHLGEKKNTVTVTQHLVQPWTTRRGRIGPLYDIGNTYPNFGCANGNISSIQSIKHFRNAHSSSWLYLIAPWPWLHSQPLDWFFGWHAKGKSTSCQSQQLDGLFFQLVGCTLKAVQSIVASNVRCLTNLFNLLHASSLLSSFFPYDFCCLFHLFLAMLCVSYRLLFAKGWRFGAKNNWVGVSLQKGSISKNTENGCIKSEIFSCSSSLFRPTAKLPGLGECGHCASK